MLPAFECEYIIMPQSGSQPTTPPERKLAVPNIQNMRTMRPVNDFNWSILVAIPYKTVESNSNLFVWSRRKTTIFVRGKIGQNCI